MPQLTDQGWCSGYKRAPILQQISAHRCGLDQRGQCSSCRVSAFAAETKSAEDKLEGFSNSELQATTHLASLGDEWEHLQKYFTMSLFCEREPQGEKTRNF